ncbi:MAG: hypothetical protein ACLRL7_14355 [Blautia wexlerae]
MIDIYTNKINSKDWILQNDLYFNLNTGNEEMSQKEIDLIWQIDEAKLTPDKHIETKYGLGTIRNLSSGCKTLINIVKHPDKVVNVEECGPNVLKIIFAMENIKIYMSRPTLFDIPDNAKIRFNNSDIVTGGEAIMPGGVRSMKGEKQMIYKNITFKADPFSYDLEFEDRITLVGGDSGTGKTVLYEMLEDIRLTDEYKTIKLFNYKSDDFLKAIKQCRDSFIVVDNAEYLINDDIRRFINFEFSNQYMLFLRNCDGLNVSDKSFKVLKFDNNRITLEEEL